MLEHHLNIAELRADSQHHCPCTGAILLSYLAQPSRTFNFHMAASQPAFDCKLARDPKQELPSSAFPKVLTHKVSSKMKWLSLYKFWNNLLCSDYNFRIASQHHRAAELGFQCLFGGFWSPALFSLIFLILHPLYLVVFTLEHMLNKYFTYFLDAIISALFSLFHFLANVYNLMYHHPTLLKHINSN